MIATQRTSLPEATPWALDEVKLVQAAQKDLSAFSPLYQRYVQQVYRYLLVRVSNVHDAQDLTSQTFLAAMQGLKQYRGQQPFIAWLLGIARHKAVDQFRSRQPDVTLDTAEILPDDADDVDEQISRQLDVEQVARKLQSIAPDRAEAISLRLFAGLEVPEIAQVMNKNEAAVRMLVFRGLRDLQGQLNVLQEKG
jgi:RNA polymerase sigma-70 factor, ECF subfamily